MTQLKGAINAVFSSWDNDRAKVYRQKYGIPRDWGTAVNVQAMVFGNTGKTSGTGVAFTRDPATGENVFYGEYLIDAQGEDVVAGVRTPKQVAKMAKDLPKSHKELLKIRKTLEKHFKRCSGYRVHHRGRETLDASNQKRKANRIRRGQHRGGHGQREAHHQRRGHPPHPGRRFEPSPFAGFRPCRGEECQEVIGSGLPAGPGAACGKIYFTAEEAVAASEKGEKVILVRRTTSPEDLRGMIAAEGILTTEGGASSHAALVARQMGKICVCGAHGMTIDYKKKTLAGEDTVLKEGDYLSVNGFEGKIYAGELSTAPSKVIQALLENKASAKKSDTYQKFNQLMTWSDQYRKLGVRTNSDSPDQVKNAIAFGAEGIGLTRTEHMFFEGDRIDAVRQMILSEDDEGRAAALEKLLPYQKEDFVGIFKALDGRPATIRLLDPPLHEFIGTMTNDQIKDLAGKLDVTPAFIKRRIEELHEENPMLGHRGCRLGIVYPEITKMQATAILEAAVEVRKKGTKVLPEIMVPLVGFAKELELQKAIIDEAAAEVRSRHGLRANELKYSVGTMIEIPRAALTANEVAAHADFFSFGTNDLTQTCLGLSRDDSSSFLPDYQEVEVVDNNPFACLDQTGVGQLVEIGVDRGRNAKPNLKVGICGEHGGDPSSVKFCHRTGLNYVSCSPFRIPIAKLAAAQASLENPIPSGKRK